MTNEERIKSKTGEEFYKEIKKVAFTVGGQYVDWEKWLASDDEHLPYIGRKASHGINECVIVEECKMFDNPYYKVMQGGLLYTVPCDEIREL